MHIDTKLIHAGEPRPPVDGSVVLPIFQNCPYIYTGNDENARVRYPRLGNTPNHSVLNEKIAALEKAEAATVTASGMAAISTSTLALIQHGEHVLVQNCLYGGTFGFFEKVFPQSGREVTYFELNQIPELSELVQPNTRGIYVESVSNPLLNIPDFKSVVRTAQKHGLITFIDNTFPTPVNFNPISLGFDIVIHSATKYLNGHSDVVAGCIAGQKSMLLKIGHLLESLGASLDPHACYLMNRGLKTLSLRLRHQNNSALRLAQALERNPRIEKVYYPGLISHPTHDNTIGLFGGFGGMISIEPKGPVEAVNEFLNKLELPYIAPSLGGPETLVTRPVVTSHRGLSREACKRIGLKDTLVRISVGLEDPLDLIEDFERALNAIPHY